MQRVWHVVAILSVAVSFSCHATQVQATLAQTTAAARYFGVDAFNRADDATRRMDNAALLALWASDGLSLLPMIQPIVGQKAIGKFLGEDMTQNPGARMEKFESS